MNEAWNCTLSFNGLNEHIIVNRRDSIRAAAADDDGEDDDEKRH